MSLYLFSTNRLPRDLYVVYDLGKHLVQGRNAIGVMLGQGINFFLSYSYVTGWWGQGLNGQRMLSFQLSLDGVVVLSTQNDGHWKGAPGPILMDSIYNGETYDARLEKPGWTSPNFNDSEWMPASLVPGPGGIFSAQVLRSLNHILTQSQLFPPIKILETMKPLSITQPSNGVYIFDFGQSKTSTVALV